ncbi:unnamed protein product [Agarophyton chilense]
MRAASPRPLAVGLEMVQTAFQPALDAFIAGRLSELDLYLRTQWESRWVWPYELYLPVLRACRRLSIPLVALAIDSDALTNLRAAAAAAAAPPAAPVSDASALQMRTHVADPAVFAAMMRESAFKTYVNECITPSYAAHYKLGLLSEATNFNTYFTTRMFRDEAMATAAVRYLVANPSTTLVCLLGADHVKFEYGVAGRVRRQLAARRPSAPLLTTVMLNPGPPDAYNPSDGSLKLEMPVGDTPLPIADYLWFSSPADANPRRQIKRRVLPPIERLTSS